MSTISLRLPESLHKRVRELAKAEDVSINQLISTALAEKMSALMTVEYLEERAARGDRGKFEAAMSKVRDSEPDEADVDRPLHSGQPADPDDHGKKTQQHDAKRFAQHQPTNNAKAIGSQEFLLPCLANDDPGIGQGKNRQNDEGHRLVQEMLESVRG